MKGMDKRWADAMTHSICAVYRGLEKPKLVGALPTRLRNAVFDFGIKEKNRTYDVVGYRAYVRVDVQATEGAVRLGYYITWRALRADHTEDT